MMYEIRNINNYVIEGPEREKKVNRRLICYIEGTGILGPAC